MFNRIPRQWSWKQEDCIFLFTAFSFFHDQVQCILLKTLMYWTKLHLITLHYCLLTHHIFLSSSAVEAKIMRSSFHTHFLGIILKILMYWTWLPLSALNYHLITPPIFLPSYSISCKDAMLPFPRSFPGYPIENSDVLDLIILNSITLNYCLITFDIFLSSCCSS